MCVKYEAPDNNEESTDDMAAALIADNPKTETQYGVKWYKDSGRILDGLDSKLICGYKVALVALAIPPIITGGIIRVKHPMVEITDKICALLVLVIAKAL